MSTCAEGGTAVLVFARAPVPGATKTRLMPHIGAEAAARLHERMTRRMLEAACAAGVGPVQLWCEPSTAHGFFMQCAQDYPITLHSQIGATLGERLCHAHHAAMQSHARTLLIGTDCPMLGIPQLQAAAGALADHAAVIIPAEDGGYVLLGLNRIVDAVFNGIDWGTSQVYAQTVQRLHASGCTWRVFSALWDIDRIEDYLRLQREFPELSVYRIG